MNGIWFPAALAAAAVLLTYFCCVRPMRRGRCAMTPNAAQSETRSETGGLDRALDHARAELSTLRAARTPVAPPTAGSSAPVSGGRDRAEQQQ